MVMFGDFNADFWDVDFIWFYDLQVDNWWLVLRPGTDVAGVNKATVVNHLDTIGSHCFTKNYSNLICEKKQSWNKAPATPFQVVTLVQTSRIELLNGPFVVPELQRISSKHLEVTILRLSIPVLDMVLRRFHQRPFYSLSSCVVRRLWEPFLAPWTDDSSVLRSWWSLPAEEFKGQGLWMAWHLDVPLCLFSGATPSAQQELCRMVQAMGMRTAHKATNFPTPAHPQWG